MAHSLSRSARWSGIGQKRLRLGSPSSHGRIEYGRTARATQGSEVIPPIVGTKSMSLFKRGNVWWYEFWFAARRVPGIEQDRFKNARKSG